MMKIESPAFVHNQTIPTQYTCKGEDISPPLLFKNIPEEAKSLALIVDDPDAPNGTFDHWIVWNLPKQEQLPEGAKVIHQGKNHFGVNRYRGPCPPPGKPHRYFFKLYALDTLLDLKDGISKQDLERAMEGHILEQAQLIGIFKKAS